MTKHPWGWGRAGRPCWAHVAFIAFAVPACAGRTLALPSDSLTTSSPKSSDGEGGAVAPNETAPDAARAKNPSIFPRNSGVVPTKSCVSTADAQGLMPLRIGTATHSFRAPLEYNSKAPTPMPLLVVLHGCGDTANNAAKWMGNLWESKPEDIRYAVLGVGGRDGACWGDDTAIVRAAVDALAECIFVDRRRIVLGGYSSGGELALRTMYAHGGDYAGLLLEHSGLSQAYPNQDLAQVTKTAPWAFPVTWVAGTNDSVFPIAQAREERDLMKAAGQPLKFIETPDDHEGRSIPNWSSALLPTMVGWITPLPE